jgi:hypothetical protein
MGFRLTVISPYPFMDALASLRVLHQLGGGDLRHTARFAIDNSQNGGEIGVPSIVFEDCLAGAGSSGGRWFDRQLPSAS